MATVNGIDLTFKTIPETTHKAIIDGDEVIPFAGPDGAFYYITRDELFAQLGGFTSGFQGELAIADTPVEDGMYIPTESGEYVNAGNIVVDLAAGVTFIIKAGSSFTDIVYPISIDTSDFATKEDVKPLEEIVVSGNQMFDYTTAIGGTYNNVTGAYSYDVNRASSPLIPLEEGQTHLTGSGWGTMSAASGRFFFYGSGGVSDFISVVTNSADGSAATMTAEIPVGSKFVAIQIVNKIDVALNPTGDMDVQSTMLNYGEEALPFEPYSYYVDGTKMKGLPQEVSDDIDKLNSVTLPSSQIFDNSTMQTGNYSGTTGDTSANTNWIRTPLIPLEEGQTHLTGSGWGTMSAASGRFMFYGSGGIGDFISSVLNPSTGFSGAVTAEIPGGADFVAINVANVVDVGLDPTNSAYAGTFMLNYGEEALPFEPYDLTSVYLNGAKIKGLDIPDDYSTGYYKLDLTGYLGQPLFTFYSKIPGTDNIYVGFEVGHMYDMSELVYVDYYRLIRANFYEFNGQSMIPMGRVALEGGENESVYLCNGRADFTGGYHGDEIMQAVEFYADGRKLAIDANISLTPCTRFEYRELSTTHETAASGDIVNPAHPVEADHAKHTVFEDGKYRTENYFTWKVDNLPVNLWYHAISCIAKPTASVVQNEYMDTADMIGDDVHKIEKVGARQYFGYNETTGLSSRAWSKLTYPKPFMLSDALRIPDEESEMFVWDRANDSKLYRQNLPLKPIASGEVWASVTEVQFLSKKDI